MICSRSQNAPRSRLVMVAILASIAIGLPTGVAMAKEPKSDEDKTVYFLGVITSRSARELDLSTAEQEMMMQGWKDAMEGKELKIDDYKYEGVAAILTRLCGVNKSLEIMGDIRWLEATEKSEEPI